MRTTHNTSPGSAAAGADSGSVSSTGSAGTAESSGSASRTDSAGSVSSSRGLGPAVANAAGGGSLHGREPARVGVGPVAAALQPPPPNRPQRRESPAPSDSWLAVLARATPAHHWRELATARAALLSPLAAPALRAVGESLAALQTYLMSPHATRDHFAQMSHAIDEAIQAQPDSPDQFVRLAYADLQVQGAVASLRWPRAVPDPAVNPWEARPA